MKGVESLRIEYSQLRASRNPKKSRGKIFSEFRDRDFEKILGHPGTPQGPPDQTLDTLAKLRKKDK